MTNISAIILDLGGVILNIDYQRTEDAFISLGVTNFGELYSQAKQSNLFDKFEKGQIGAQEFRNILRQLSSLDLEDDEIDAAWNAMLLDLPPSRLSYLQQLSQEFPLYLLSNTNEIHVAEFERKLNESQQLSALKSCFKDWYYSSEIGLRKPDPEVFEFVCHTSTLIPDNTLFVDDTMGHVEGAKKVELHALHLDLTVQPNSLESALPLFLAQFD